MKRSLTVVDQYAAFKLTLTAADGLVTWSANKHKRELPLSQEEGWHLLDSLGLIERHMGERSHCLASFVDELGQAPNSFELQRRCAALHIDPILWRGVSDRGQLIELLVKRVFGEKASAKETRAQPLRKRARKTDPPLEFSKEDSGISVRTAKDEEALRLTTSRLTVCSSRARGLTRMDRGTVKESMHRLEEVLYPLDEEPTDSGLEQPSKEGE